ncbi:MAG: DUF4397 domain-containing protein [Chloroflexota bacterium]
MRKWLLLCFAFLFVSIPLLAQEEDSTTAFVRATHFAVDAPEVDVYINGDLTLEAITFPQVSDWIEVEAGTYTVEIVPTGGAIADALLSEEYDLNADDWATVAVIGEVSRDNLTMQAIIEDLSNITEGLTYISVFHAITDLEAVNVFVGEIELVRLLSYPGTLNGSDGYAGDSIPSDNYIVDIRDDSGESIASLETGLLGVGSAYFVGVVGTASNPQIVLVPTDVDALTAEETDTMEDMDDVEVGEGVALIRLGHFSVSAPDVDIYLNGDLLLEAVQFGDVTDEYLELDAGIYDVALVPTGESLENAVYSGEIVIVTDSINLVAAIGFAEDDSLTVVAVAEDNEAPANGFTRIAMFQSIPSLAGFDLSANGDTLIQSLSYPNAFDGAGDGYVSVDILAGAYDFVVTGDNAELNVGSITTGEGRVYLIVPAGTSTAPIYFLIPSDFPVSEE